MKKLRTGVMGCTGLVGAARVFSAVAREDINVEMISSGASEVAYHFIVRVKDVERAVNAVHREFF